MQPEDRDFLKENLFGKMPIVQLVPIERMAFPVWDFQAKVLKEKAKELGIEDKIKPLQVIFDQKSKKSIVILYFKDDDFCPFLDEKNLCRVHKYRSFICKQFPIQKLNLEDEKDIIGLGDCNALPKDFLKNLEGKNFKEKIRFLYDYFGEAFLAMMQYNIVYSWMNMVVIDMIKKGVIQPLFNVRYNVLLKKIEKYPKVDLTDFLVEKGIYSKEEMGKLIERFNNLEDAKEELSKNLNI